MITVASERDAIALLVERRQARHEPAWVRRMHAERAKNGGRIVAVWVVGGVAKEVK